MTVSKWSLLQIQKKKSEIFEAKPYDDCRLPQTFSCFELFFAKTKKQQLAVTVSLIERESIFFEKFLDGFCKINCQLLEVIVWEEAPKRESD
jgi:hypothetical protein